MKIDLAKEWPSKIVTPCVRLSGPVPEDQVNWLIICGFRLLAVLATQGGKNGEASIANAIFVRIESSDTVDHEAWHIGLTHDPNQRARERDSNGEDIRFWNQWQAKSLPDAQEIESFFVHSKKLISETGGGSWSA